MVKNDLMALLEQIERADAVVVGGGSGLSSAAGYNHYHWMPYFQKCMQDFIECYGFSSPFAGFYHCYSSPEQQWAYYARYLQAMWDAPTGQPYLDLKVILDKKDYFILTTNVDGQFNRVFDKERICSYQGDFSYLQCCQPCHDQIYMNREITAKMNQSIQGVILPSDHIPRCEECGRIMIPWVRDDTFLEGTAWKESVSRYERFLEKYIIEQPDKKVLLLELGVGEMTPSIIKLPFWDMTVKNRNVFYACLNEKKSSAPEHIKEKSLYIAQDLAVTLHDLKVF
ncbi:MAG: NAD-dependent protein deacetylase, SIR2 family [Clostridia bacterium]|nr:NAD-dependent protein deacetylase, SIR2 family [Clostridia bacterium]NCC43038.1 NAD-dependent protein deacetylase, SIR2 family [Clostridia bacterium]